MPRWIENQSIFSRVDQYIELGLKDVIVDPHPDFIYTERKIVKEQANSGKDTVYLTLVILVLFLSDKGR